MPTAAGRILIIRVERALRFLTHGVRLVRRSARLAPVAHIERWVTMAQLRALIAVEGTSSYALAGQQVGLSSRLCIVPCATCSDSWVRRC